MGVYRDIKMELQIQHIVQARPCLALRDIYENNM
jgi:hypothetical protein